MYQFQYTEMGLTRMANFMGSFCGDNIHLVVKEVTLSDKAKDAWSLYESNVTMAAFNDGFDTTGKQNSVTL